MSSNAAKLKKRAAEFEQKKQFDKALQLYIQVLEESPGDDEADVALYNRVGDLLMREGRPTEAVTYYEKAVDLYAEGGFFNNAIALCNKILRQAPHRNVIYYKLGKISAQKGFTSDAKQNFLEYADRMQNEGRLDEAFRALKEFADLCPDQDDIRLMLADQLSKKGRTGEAIEQLQRLYDKFESEGRNADMRATVDRMKAIDAAAEPITGPKAQREKASDLVFLDLGDDIPVFRPGRNPTPRLVPALRKSGEHPRRSSGSVSRVSEASATTIPAAPVTPVTPPETVPTITPISGLEGVPFLDLSEVAAPDAVARTEGLDTQDNLVIETGTDAGATPLDGLIKEEEFQADALPQAPKLNGLESSAVLEVDGTAETPALLPDIETIEPVSPPALAGDDLDFALEEHPHHEDLSPLIQVESDEPLVFFGSASDDVSPPLGSESDDLSPLPGHGEELSPLFANEGEEVPSVFGHARDVPALTLDPEIDEVPPPPRISGGVLQFVEGAERLLPAEDPVVLHSPTVDLPAVSMPDAPSEEASAPEPVVPAVSVPVDVVGDLRAHLEEQPDDWTLRRELGELLLTEGEREAGLAELEQAMVGFEGADDFLAAREIVQMLLRVDPDSLKHYQKRVEYIARIGDSANLLDAYMELGEALFRSGQVAKAKAVYQHVLDLAPDDARARAALSAFGESTSSMPDPAGAPHETAASETAPLAVDEEVPATGDANESPLAGAERVEAESETAESAVAAVASEESVTTEAAAAEATPAEAELAETEPREAETAEAVPQTDVVQADVEAHPAQDSPVQEPSTREHAAEEQTAREHAASESRLRHRIPRPTPIRVTGTQRIIPRPDAPRTVAPRPQETSDSEFVNLGDWLREDNSPKSTRFVIDAQKPSGNEAADFADMLRRFKEGVAQNVDLDDSDSHYDLGVAYKEMGLLDEAISEFQKALRGTKQRVRTYEALGQAFLDKKQVQVAATLLTRSLNEPGVTDEELVGVLYLLGYASEALHQTEAAIRYYHRVFAIDIHFRDVAERLAQLEHTPQ